MIGLFFRAFVIAVVTSVLFPMALAYHSNEFSKLSEPIPADFNDWSFDTQRAWIEEHELPVEGFGYLVEVFEHPVMREEFLIFQLSAFGVVLASCIVMGLWQTRTHKLALQRTSPGAGR